MANYVDIKKQYAQLSAICKNGVVVTGEASLVIHGLVPSCDVMTFAITREDMEANYADCIDYSQVFISAKVQFDLELRTVFGMTEKVDGMHVSQLAWMLMEEVTTDSRRIANLVERNENSKHLVPRPDIDSYVIRCKAADWHYAYSDDASVYKAGRKECEELRLIAERFGSPYVEIYTVHSDK